MLIIEFRKNGHWYGVRKLLEENNKISELHLQYSDIVCVQSLLKKKYIFIFID